MAQIPRFSTPKQQSASRQLYEPSLDDIDKDPYFAGDLYSPVQPQAWNIKTESMPYLRYIKSLVPQWPKLNYLSDFMEASTLPSKWRVLHPADIAARAQRTRVTVLDAAATTPATGVEAAITRRDINSIDQLREYLSDSTQQQQQQQQNDRVGIRIFIIEDLSRCMIEEFGARFDIDPTFFRAQITDYLWFNTRDPWVELPELTTLLRRRNFFTLRFYQTRYFPSELSHARAKQEAWEFNVLRRPIDDHNRKQVLDKEGAVFARVRSKSSVWIRQNKSHESGVVAIFLVDPSMKSGWPLWNGSASFKSPPSMHDQFAVEPQPASHYEQIIQSTMDILRTQTDINEHPLAVTLGLLQVICSEWFTLITYLDTRLTQIDWEIENPQYRFDPSGLDSSLNKLHVWRRAIQTQQAMVTETLDRAFNYASETTPTTSATTSSNAASSTQDLSSSPVLFSALQHDFTSIQARLRAIQVRIDNIVNIATASISIEENKRAIRQNQNFGRLTYLAVVFVPLSFISSFLSMTSDVASLRQTFWIYFVLALPLTAGALVVVRYYVQLLRLFGVDRVVIVG